MRMVVPCLVALLLALSLWGCGGGGSSTPGPGPLPATGLTGQGVLPAPSGGMVGSDGTYWWLKQFAATEGGQVTAEMDGWSDSDFTLQSLSVLVAKGYFAAGTYPPESAVIGQSGGGSYSVSYSFAVVKGQAYTVFFSDGNAGDAGTFGYEITYDWTDSAAAASKAAIRPDSKLRK